MPVIASTLTPLIIAEQLIRKDAPIMLGVSLLTISLALDGNLGWLDGAFLLLGLIVYTIFALKQSRAENREVQNEYAEAFAQKEASTAKRTIFNFGFILALLQR